MSEKTLEELREELIDFEETNKGYEINDNSDLITILNTISDLEDKIIELELDSYSFSSFNHFEKYLINVGVRSAEYSYPEELLFEHIDYFKKCYKDHLSAYKALLFFSYYLEEIGKKKSE